MQATNKSDATQVYEGAVKSSRTGAKGTLKYILKPLTIFGYHYFIEGIRAVQKDGPTKELEKITNLSYEETIKVMHKNAEKIRERIDSDHPFMKLTGGYGHNYILAADAPVYEYNGRELYEHCVYACDARSMTIYSDKPCLQVYTANLIGGHADFKGNTPVIRRSAVALEPQFEPDSANAGRYILRPGEHYDYLTVYKFTKL